MIGSTAVIGTAAIAAGPPSAAPWVLGFAVGILPVLAFLGALVVLDSYKLVGLRAVVQLLAFGSAVALLCALVNPRLQLALGLDFRSFALDVAPWVEEILKASAIVFAVTRRRIGFLVDAAIWGFAVGAGFATVENVHYSLVLDQPNPAVWVIRGFGTAIMHGGTTSLVAIISKQLSDLSDSAGPHLFLPGLALAVAIHSAYNHFYLSPLLSALTLLLVLPLLFVAVFEVSERATRHWLGVGFDTDQDLLQAIHRGEISETRVGRYLRGLKDRFPGTTVLDMLCLIRLRLELSIKAKGALLIQKAGLAVPSDPKLEESFVELRFLEKSIGRTGLSALQPIFRQSSRDLWQVHLLRRKQ